MPRVVLLLALMATTLVMASGLAWAVTKIGTNGPETLRGTNRDDNLIGKAGDDVLFGERSACARPYAPSARGWKCPPGARRSP